MMYGPKTFPGFMVTRVFHDGQEVKRCVGFDPDAGIANYMACNSDGLPRVENNELVIHQTLPGTITTEPPLETILNRATA